MNTSLALLGLLAPQPSYGYDLKQSYDRWFGAAKALAVGQVYSTLARMARDGLIAATGAEPGGGPDRKRYVVTREGRDRLTEWMGQADPPSAQLQSELLAKVVIAILVDHNPEALLDLQRQAHRQRMRELTRAKAEAGLAAALVYDHGLFHIEADLRWIDLASARLRQLVEEVNSRG